MWICIWNDFFFLKGFKLHFYFEPNEYFTNSELTKEYEMKCAPPEGDPFSFDGPEIYRCKGNVLKWFKHL